MANLGKRINIQKKFKKHPSTQSSGMPLKSIQGISDINSAKFKTARYTNSAGRPPAGTHTTSTLYPNFDDNAQGAGQSNPFYIYLLKNAITRTTAPINETNAAFNNVSIKATGLPSYQITVGEKLYIYHPITFKYLEVTAGKEIDNTITTLRIESISITKGADCFPSGSFIVKAQKTASVHSLQVKIGSSSTVYLIYLAVQNAWYSSSMYFTNLGTTIGTETNENTLRASEYIASDNCTVSQVTLNFYTNVTADLEFAVYRTINTDGNTSNVLWSQMTHTNIDATFTLNTTYVQKISITGNNNLTAGDGVAIIARNTSYAGAVRIYGTGFMTINGNPS